MFQQSVGSQGPMLRPEHRAMVCVALSAMLLPCAPVAAQEVTVPAVYEPYEFLIGEWEVGPEGRPAAALTRFRWGPKKTYIWYSGALLVDGKEQPTFEGLLVWNGVRHHLDMLLVLDQSTGDLVQEQGSVSVASDGSVVREITVYYSEGNALPPDWKTAAGPEGATAHFRHTFAPAGPDLVRTSILWESRDGWIPSFPGSDALVMKRRRQR